MSSMTLAVFGLSELRARFASIMVTFPAQVDAEIQYAGIACAKYAKIACAVDSGRLRSSIQAKPAGLMKCIVGTDVFYASYVEHGTYGSRDQPYVDHPVGMAPRPFLRPAFEKARVELIANLKALKV
jgi:phage gpG-like protein